MNAHDKANKRAQKDLSALIPLTTITPTDKTEKDKVSTKIKKRKKDGDEYYPGSLQEAYYKKQGGRH